MILLISFCAFALVVLGFCIGVVLGAQVGREMGEERALAEFMNDCARCDDNETDGGECRERS